MGAKVSIVRCKDYESEKVYEKVKEGVNLLGGTDKFVTKGEKVLLKPNFLLGRSPEKCVNTHPAIVKAVARLALEVGAKPIIGDSPRMGSALKVAEECRVAEVARELGIEIVEFEPVEVKHPEGKFFKRFILGKAVLEADKIINLPKLKTHVRTLLTLAVKNTFGCIPGTRKAQWHVSTSQAGSEYFSKMLLDLCTLIDPVLSIVDGVMSMEGKGPTAGKPRNLGLIITGNDAVAVDGVISKVIGVHPEQFPALKVALKENYGIGHPKNIEVLGEQIDEVKVDDYQFPQKIVEFEGFIKTLMGFLKCQLTTHPSIENEKCKRCNSCVDACPLNCITSYESGLVINTKKCIQCMCCMEACPHNNIDLKEGTLLKFFRYLKIT
jgi:uncharacterized protein (DUF362 family)/Pyruvate/2-oxoacid:ferredoxin oxidoreductase delta subunit